MKHKLFHIIHVEYLATKCVAANRKQPNARNYERNESRRESGGKTDRQAGRQEKEKWNGSCVYESGERFGQPLSLHHAGQLPCNFVYVGKQLSRSHFSFISLVSPSYLLVRSLTLSPSSCFLFLSLLSLCAYIATIINYLQFRLSLNVRILLPFCFSQARLRK